MLARLSRRLKPEMSYRPLVQVRLEPYLSMNVHPIMCFLVIIKIHTILHMYCSDYSLPNKSRCTLFVVPLKLYCVQCCKKVLALK